MYIELYKLSYRNVVVRYLFDLDIEFSKIKLFHFTSIEIGFP